MRPKVLHRPEGKTLRTKRHLAWWVGEFSQEDDVDLHPDLAELIQSYRGLYAMKLPSAQDKRATLRDIAFADDASIKLIASVIDPWVEPLLVSASWKHYRVIYPDGTSPNEATSIKAWSPEFLRQMARNALASVPSKGGRRTTIHRDMEFAMALARYWTRTNGTLPTVTVHNEDTADESSYLS